MTVIIDYDTGNLRSVENALRRAGGEFVTSADIPTILAADRILLPGVGEASSAMAKLRERGLDSIIPKLTGPGLGICIGAQLLCRRSEEGSTDCLGIFDCDVRRLSDPDSLGLKIPEMGWNTVEGLRSPLFAGIEPESYVYSVHSFAPDVCRHTIATPRYGTAFSAALQNNNFFGTQFHPEKSGAVGARIIENFLRL